MEDMVQLEIYLKKMKIKFVMPHASVVSNIEYDTMEEVIKDLKIMGFEETDGSWTDGESVIEII